MSFPIGPLGLLFPEDDEGQRDSRSASLQAMGQTDPITLWRGQVVDGKNRQAACEALGIEPRYEHLPDHMTAEAVMRRVVGRNVALRNKPGQIAMAAARLVLLSRERRADREDADPQDHLPRVTPKTAADMFDVSSRHISYALVVLRAGNAQLIAEVESGRIGPAAAAALASHGAVGVQARYDYQQQREERQREEASRRAARLREGRRRNQTPGLFSGRLPANSRHWVDRPEPIPAPSSAERLQALYPDRSVADRMYFLLEDANALARQPDFLEQYEARRVTIQELGGRLAQVLKQTEEQHQRALDAIWQERDRQRAIDNEAAAARRAAEAPRPTLFPEPAAAPPEAPPLEAAPHSDATENLPDDSCRLGYVPAQVEDADEDSCAPGEPLEVSEEMAALLMAATDHAWRGPTGPHADRAG